MEELVAIKEEKIYHCRSRLGHNSFFFFLLLYPLRHCRAAYQAEILSAASASELADIEQLKKIVPLITCEISFGQKCLRLVFGVNVTNLDRGVQINPVKQQIQSNSVGPCPLNCLALSSCWFLDSPLLFCFLFRLHRTYSSTYLPTHHQDEMFFVFL